MSFPQNLFLEASNNWIKKLVHQYNVFGQFLPLLFFLPKTHRSFEVFQTLSYSFAINGIAIQIKNE